MCEVEFWTGSHEVPLICRNLKL